MYRKGAEVVYESLEKIHASGHACQEELKIMHSLIKPKFFIPIHGEYRHLKKHADLAKEMGLKDNNILICDIGDTVELTQKSMRRAEKFQAGSRLVDGLSIDETQTVVRDRKLISVEGIIVVVCPVSAESGLILQEPDVIGKGAGLTDKQIEIAKSFVTLYGAPKTVFEKIDCFNVSDLSNKEIQQLKQFADFLRNSKK